MQPQAKPTDAKPEVGPFPSQHLNETLAASASWLESLRDNAEAHFDPLGVVAPLMHAQAAWWLHPQELYQRWSRFLVDLVALQLHTAVKLFGGKGEDLVVPHGDDARFADPAWSEQPHFDVLKQWYLFLTRQLQDALFETPGLSPKAQRRAAFWWRTWLNAVAPSNFLFTNPVALRKAIETRGDSLRRGLEIFFEDMQAGSVRMTSVDEFQVGKNLATTPGAVVFRNRMLEVIHYAPTQAEVRRTPVVIVTPWINKFYVLDLTPKKSMVKHLLDQGFDVYITSWKNPGTEQAETSFDDYLVDGVDQAVRVAREQSRADKVTAVGYCIGGTLLSTYMAWLNKRYAPADVPVSSFTLLTTLTDFHAPGEIDVFIDEGSVRWMTNKMRARGFLEGSEMASSFRLLRSNSLIWQYVVNGWLLGERPTAFDVLYWNMDSTRMPYRMHSYYLREMYLHNNLIVPDALTIGGETIDLGRIAQPLYAVSAADDHIAPWQQTFAINRFVQGPKRFALSSSGHILGIVNPPVTPPKRYYRVGAAHRGQSVEAWQGEAVEHQGTWWEDWTVWLAEKCGPLAAPPALTSAAYPELAAAPGTYVLER